MMENSKKVVQFNSKSEPMDDSSLFARMPAPFSAVKECGYLSLQPLLQSLFDNIDDALFELADRAQDNDEQNMYFESMREIRIKRRGMELGFSQEVNETFRQLVKNTTNPPQLADKEESVSAEQLALVEDDELEELVAVDGMVAKAASRFAPILRDLTARLDSLVEGVTITNTNNPFGPGAICRAFNTVCHGLELDIKAKLVLFKLFDRHVMSSLDKVYEACNGVLIDGGILPELSSGHTVTQQVADDNRYTKAGNDEVFSDLQQLLHRLPQTHNTAGSGLVAPGQAPALPQNTIMTLLQQIQQSQMLAMEKQQKLALQGTVPEQLDITQALNQLLLKQMPAQTVSMGEVDNDAINLVAMLFQFVLDDRNLAAPMKALIARLQIPIIKVAMLDKSFFSKGGHPARKLLNEIAHASIGWMQPTNVERDPLYKNVSQVVNRLLNEFDGDTALFDETLADFLAFLEVEQRRSGLVAQRTVNAEDGKATTELARTRVQDALNERVAGKSLPKVVITLLEEAWSNVLFLIYLKEGEQKNWNSALRVVDELLWSVEPMKDISARQRLLKLVPSLLKNLRAGLTKIAYNPFDMNQLFADLEKIHLTQLKELNVAKPARKPAMPQAAERTLDQMLNERSQHGQSLKRLDAELAAFDALGDTVERSVLDVSGAKGDVDATVTPSDARAATSEVDAQVRGEDAATVDVAASSASTQASDESEEVLQRQVVDKIVVSGAVDDLNGSEQPLADDDPELLLVNSMAMGNWVELHQEDGKKFRCRLAAVIRSTGKHIFVNRAGIKVAEYGRQTLARALKSGQVTTIDDSLLFDRALESVIGNLRTMTTSSK